MQGPLTGKLTVPITSSTMCVIQKRLNIVGTRIVFKEYAMLLEQVKKMGDVFTILADLI